MSRDHGRFARRNRLTQSTEFRKVFRSTIRSEDERLLVIACSNGLGYPRLGLAIPRKRVKRAATRNRLKRLIRESFRKHQEMLGELDIVVTVNKEQKNPNNRSINESINNHWKKLIICSGWQS